MKTHSRCRHCNHRKKLNKHPAEYLRQPKCQCGARSWRKDEYRHRVELREMRLGLGRYVTCYADCFHHPHRLSSHGCKFIRPGEYR